MVYGGVLPFSDVLLEVEMWKPGWFPLPLTRTSRRGVSLCLVSRLGVSFRVAGIILDPRYAVGQVGIPTQGHMYLEGDGMQREAPPCSATGGTRGGAEGGTHPDFPTLRRPQHPRYARHRATKVNASLV